MKDLSKGVSFCVSCERRMIIYMNKKIVGGVLGTAFALILLTGNASANEFDNMKEGLDKLQYPSNSTTEMSVSNVLADIVEVDTLNNPVVSNAHIKSADLKEEFQLQKETQIDKTSIGGIVPKETKDVLNIETATGVNPIYFPSTDLSKVVQDWKVVGEQLLRKSEGVTSPVLRVLTEGQEIEVIEKGLDGWYKVKIVEPVKVKHKDREKEQNIETVGYIASEYIQLVEETEKQLILEQNEMRIADVKKSLIQKIDEEVEQERLEKERLEQDRLEKEKVEKEARERLAAEKVDRAKKERETARTNPPPKRVASVTSVTSDTVSSKSTSAPSETGGSAVSNAQKYLGVPYQYSSNPNSTSTFDCSSFTQRVFAEAGISLPRTSGSQAGLGTTVSKSELQVGDLVFFNTSGSGISHVGIYAGSGKFVGAQSSTGVAYASMNDSYWGSKFITAKRVK